MPLITHDYTPPKIVEELKNNNILKDFAVFMRDNDVKYRTTSKDDEQFTIEELDYTIDTLIDKYNKPNKAQ